MLEVGGYKIGKLLGVGAFGETYIAIKEGKQFALKLIKEEAVLKGFDINRFKRECRSLEKIKHDNIVKLIEYGQAKIGNDLRYFLVMEYLSGQDLEKYFQSNSFEIDEKSLKNILVQVLSGLNAMHKKNILHRDIKPQNIFITDNGVIKLLDFGLVKMIDYTTLTMTGEGPKGTPLYIPPEAIRGEKLDYRSDLYSLGVMIYYIVTKGNYPFKARNILQLINMALNQPPTVPKTYNKRISNEFENLILMLLSKQPYERNILHEELAEAIKTTPIILETVIRGSKKTSKLKKEVWYRLLPTEKSEILEFIKNSGELNGIEYVANYLPRYQKTLKELQEKNVKYFFDPATNRLAYSTFSQTKGLVALPYCWDSFNRLTPDKLKDITSIKRYVSQVIDWQAQWGVDFFVAPFHYHHNLGDPWLETDIKLLHETVDYARKKYKNMKVYSGICLNMEEYTTETNRLALLNEFSICKPDGFIFYGDEINETTTNPARLYAYIETIRLFSKLGKKIIGARLGTLGLGVLASGADIVTTGLASLTGFSERGLLQERGKGYTMKTKYYIPQLMLTLPVKLAKDIINEDKSLACNCNFCKKSSNIEAVTKTHYLKIRQNEIDEINSIEDNLRLGWFVEKTQKAINRCKELHHAVFELRPSYYAHLNTWLNVLGSYLEGKTDEI
jgi:serine/threonine-protein kinase